MRGGKGKVSPLGWREVILTYPILKPETLLNHFQSFTTCMDMKIWDAFALNHLHNQL